MIFCLHFVTCEYSVASASDFVSYLTGGALCHLHGKELLVLKEDGSLQTKLVEGQHLLPNLACVIQGQQWRWYG